jgi:DNA-binding IclR family transcriptional regulator
MAGGSTAFRGRSVISKVAALLGAFSPTAPEMSLRELADATGLPVSTAHRLACELVTWGGLERLDGGGYRIGPRMGDIGSLVARRRTLREAMLPFVGDLREATREDVHLAVLDGIEVVYVDGLVGASVNDAPSSCGARLPSHATAGGKVLLAHAPASLVREAVLAGLHGYTPHTIVTAAHLHRTLADIRRTGVGYAREELAVGSFSVASPVLDADGGAVAALSVTLRAGLGNRAATLRRVGPAVRTAALSASRGLQRRAWPEPPDGSEGGRRSHGRDPSVRVTGLLAPG